MNKLFAIGIPTVNRYDLLKGAIAQYKIDFPDTMIVIVDNGNQQIPVDDQVTVFRMANNIGCTASWNLLCNFIFGITPWAMIMNDDVYNGKTQSQVTGFLEQHGQDYDFFCTNHHWCNWMMNKHAFKQVGEFDQENFFNYYSDNDYHRRMKLAQIRFVNAVFLDPKDFHNSMSIKKDPSLNGTFEQSKANYIAKWGALPPHELYQTPYNK